MNKGAEGICVANANEVSALGNGARRETRPTGIRNLCAVTLCCGGEATRAKRVYMLLTFLTNNIK